MNKQIFRQRELVRNLSKQNKIKLCTTVLLDHLFVNRFVIIQTEIYIHCIDSQLIRDYDHQNDIKMI